jgi:menaquinone-dependent protoporphyrinogen IX oxidase
MLDRETRQVRAEVVPNVSREVLQNKILENVLLGSKVYTDRHQGYNNMDGFVRRSVTTLMSKFVERFTRTALKTSGACSSAA